MLPYQSWTRYKQRPLAHSSALTAYPHTNHARALHTSSTADQPQLPEWVTPPLPDRGRQKSRNARTERRQSYSLQRIRSCYTVGELAAVVEALQVWCGARTQCAGALPDRVRAPCRTAG